MRRLGGYTLALIKIESRVTISSLGHLLNRKKTSDRQQTQHKKPLKESYQVALGRAEVWIHIEWHHHHGSRSGAETSNISCKK